MQQQQQHPYYQKQVEFDDNPVLLEEDEDVLFMKSGIGYGMGMGMAMGTEDEKEEERRQTLSDEDLENKLKFVWGSDSTIVGW